LTTKPLDKRLKAAILHASTTEQAMNKYEVTIEQRNGREVLWTRCYWCNADSDMAAMAKARSEYPNGNFFSAKVK
jgi:hypothetical protein